MSPRFGEPPITSPPLTADPFIVSNADADVVGLTLIATAMERFPSETEVQSKALGCLCNLCGNASARAFLSRVQNVDLLLRAVTEHNFSEAVVKKALNVLQVVCCSADADGACARRGMEDSVCVGHGLSCGWVGRAVGCRVQRCWPLSYLVALSFCLSIFLYVCTSP